MLPSLLTLLAAAVVTVYGSVPTYKWEDPNVSEPKDFRVARFGLGCRTQVIFKRGGLNKNDQSYSYSVIGLKDGQEIVLPQDPIRRNTPISVVNASAGHLRGAYRLCGDDSDYSLLPIQVWGCIDAASISEYQVKASKEGSPDWISPKFSLTNFSPPDQVTKLKAVRNAKSPSKIHISWEQTPNNQYTTVEGAFVLAGKTNFNDRIYSEFVKSHFIAKGSSATIEVGPVPVNITVVRYNNTGNGALSDVENALQVHV